MKKTNKKTPGEVTYQSKRDRPDIWKTQQVCCLQIRRQQGQLAADQPWFSISEGSVVDCERRGAPGWCWPVIVRLDEPPGEMQDAAVQLRLPVASLKRKNGVDFSWLYLCWIIGADDVTSLHLPPLSPPDSCGCWAEIVWCSFTFLI